MKILIVEDERRLSDSLIQVLSDESYAADPAYDGVTAAELAEVNDYDLVVLDLNIPPPTGLEALNLHGAESAAKVLEKRNRIEHFEGVVPAHRGEMSVVADEMRCSSVVGT
ncbi:MAG: response regulator [Thermoanaerobaculia bacterium]